MGTGGATPLEPPKDRPSITRSMKIINLYRIEICDKVAVATIHVGNSVNSYDYGDYLRLCILIIQKLSYPMALK